MAEGQIGIVACSGASNTGSYSDLVARKLMQSGKAKMLCLARFSVDEKFAEKSKGEYSNIVVLDGCPINCAEETLKQRSIANYKHINPNYALEKVTGKVKARDFSQRPINHSRLFKVSAILRIT